MIRMKYGMEKPNAYLSRGLSYYYKGQYNKAITDYNKSIEIDPTLSNSYNNRAIVYTKLKDYNRAIKRLESSITELEKKHSKNNMEIGETYFTLGSMHQIQGNSKQAKVAFQQALSIFSPWLGSEHPRVWKLKTRISNLN